MSIPLTRQEAQRQGLKALPQGGKLGEISMSGLHFSPLLLDYLCYVGPCVDGTRTLCYHTDSGCDACFESSEGCE